MVKIRGEQAGCRRQAAKWRVSSGADVKGEILIWDTDPRAEEQIVANLNGHTDGMTAVDWSPDVEHIAAASEDGTVLIWNAEFGFWNG